MNDKTSTLKGLAQKLSDGLNRVNQEAKDKAAGKQPNQGAANAADDHDELHEALGEQATVEPSKERLSAKDGDDIDDGFIIDAEPQPEKPKAKSFGKGMRLLLIGGLAAGAWYMTSMKAPTIPVPADPSSIAQEEPLAGPAPGAVIEAPAFDLNTPDSPSDQQEDLAIGSSNETGSSLSFGAGNTGDSANDPIGNESLTADLNDQFAAMGEEGTETIDPFSGKLSQSVSPTPTASAPAATQPKTPTAEKTAATATAAADSLGLLEAPQDSPFSGGHSNGNELGGGNFQKPDSGSGELLDQNANADVATLKASIAEKDGRIGTLEAEMGKLKTDLAQAKQELTNAGSGNGKKPVAQTAQHKPAQPAKTPQRSTPTQRVANAPKAPARPQICVTAVAQAARNCTTCVPHAFISHRGAETMVGQGDFLEGLRVNIVGDRLDLQNANGDVVHKFWSSPNGCAG